MLSSRDVRVLSHRAKKIVAVVCMADYNNEYHTVLRSLLKASMSNDRQLRRTVVGATEDATSSNLIATVITEWSEMIVGSTVTCAGMPLHVISTSNV